MERCLGMGGHRMCQGQRWTNQQVPLVGRVPTHRQDILHDLPHPSFCHEHAVEQFEDLWGRTILFLPGMIVMGKKWLLIHNCDQFLQMYSFVGVTSITFAISIVFMLLFESPFMHLQKLLVTGKGLFLKIILQGGPNEFFCRNWSILYAVWEIFLFLVWHLSKST